MKKIKSLTCLLAIILLSACGGHTSEAFSSSDIPSSSSDISSSSSGGSDVVSYYDNYYSSLVSWQNGEDLKNQLHAIIRNGYQPLSYTTPNYETNIDADHTKSDFEYLDVIYSADNLFKTETGNSGWQREHAWCASLMCGSLTANAVKMKGRATDFHNLFAANASANMSRGNKNYGTADTSASNYTDRTVKNGDDGYSYSSNFEPGDIDKGRLARAIFYMATMYKDDEMDTINNVNMKGLTIQEDPVDYVAGSYEAFAIGNLSTLLTWNYAIDVDYLEMQHNVSVYQHVYEADGYAQGNRNPYVDFPSLAEYVFGSKKNRGGKLKDLVPASSYLECDKHEFSHYALKEATRSYAPGEQIANNDYKVVKVYKDYSYETINEGYVNSLADHTFSNADGESIDASIIVEEQNIATYKININASGAVSSGEIVLSASGIDKSKPGVEQEVTYSGYDFLLKYESTAETPLTINNISTGGVTFGSGPKPITSVIIKTKNSYTIDAAYVKAFAGNKNSSYQLVIKVGDSVLLNSASISSPDLSQYGGTVTTPLVGQLSYIFTGSNSLKINSIAFNAISV